MQEKETSYFTQSDILALGWTKKLINDYLPDPVLRKNPFYSSAAPMKTWNKDDVFRIMEQEDFKAAFAKAQKRKESASRAASKAVETKKQNLLKNTEAFVNSITIRVIDDEKLIKKAKRNAYDEYCLKHPDMYVEYSYYAHAEETDVNRWVVNYIRHQLTSYDERLFTFRGKVGKEDAAVLLRELILERIAEVYPKYKEECKDQIKTRRQLIEFMNGDYMDMSELHDYERPTEERRQDRILQEGSI